MDYLVPGLCALALIVGIVALVMGRATWRWYHITLVFLVMVSSLGFFYLGARTLKTHATWRKEVSRYRDEIAKVSKETKLLLDGVVEDGKVLQKSIDQLQSEVHRALVERGRAWFNVVKDRAARENGGLVVTVEQPAGLEVKMPLFVLSENDVDNEGRYLGEYRVTEIKEKQVTLAPVLAMSQPEIDRAVAERGPLALYEILPLDTHKAFVDWTEEQMRTRIPNADEFLRDGHEARPNDPPDRVWLVVQFLKASEFTEAPAAGEPPPEKRSMLEGDLALLDPKTAQELIAKGDAKMFEPAPDQLPLLESVWPEEMAEWGKNRLFVRQLRNYARAFRAAYQRQARTSAGIVETDAEIGEVKTAQEKADQDIAARKTEVAGLTSDRDRFHAEHELLRQYAAAVDARLADIRRKLGATFQANLRLATELTELQFKVRDEISRRNPATDATAAGTK